MFFVCTGIKKSNNVYFTSMSIKENRVNLDLSGAAISLKTSFIAAYLDFYVSIKSGMHLSCIPMCNVEAIWHIFWITVILAKGNMNGGLLPLKMYDLRLGVLISQLLSL